MKISHDDLVDNSDKIEEFNNELTLSLLHATQTQFHNCAKLVNFQNGDLLLCLNFQISTFFTLYFK